MGLAKATSTPRDDGGALVGLLVRQVAVACKLDFESIDVGERFSTYGLDSLGAIRLVAALSQHLGRPLSPTLVWEYPTIAALASHLDGRRDGDEATTSSPLAEPLPRYDAQEPIAIVGMACRLPGAADVASFWQMLRDGVDAVSEVPAGRGWDELLSAPGVDPAERSTVRRGAFLERLDAFDPTFFGISPREAISMDPQQRLMLELCWEAIEDAGILPGSLKGTPTGVFAGAIWSDYESLLYRGAPGQLGQYTCAGNHRSIIANRISYVLGLEGPSFTLDSACSSGLVVAHLACDSLRRGESTVALAGAVNLNVLPSSALAVSRFGVLSPDGRCYSFDARANGYVRGEGGGVLVLKTLSRAIADGDPIRAVILGSAVNNDGASNGLTAPSRAAQEAVLRAAYRRAGVRPDEVQYVEAHGTGTPLGDPIEARALGAVLGAGRSADAPLLIGSAKTNVGHLEAAAGVVGLIKATLAIEHRLVPPSLHFDSPTPHAPLTELGLAVPTATRPWPAPERPLTAGVSAFGFGGTNGHVVLQEWPAPVAGTLLRAPAEEKAETEATMVLGSGGPEAARGVVFVFPGQGAQWHGMARSLLQSEPVFRATIEACDRHIRRYLGWSLLDELTAPRDASRLDRIEVSLPAIISIDLAVSAFWRSVGVEPAAVVGHSTGEIAAAHVAGALDLDDTMRIICAYGRFVGRFAGRGGMAFVGLPWDEAASALAGFEGRVFRAIQDSAEGTVVAGAPDAIAALLAALSARGVFCRPVSMNVGPHSPLVDSVRDELFEALQGIRPRRGRIPLISEVTGAEVDGEALDAAHWVRNFGDPAFFSGAVDELIRRGHRVFLDVGPHPITRHSVEANLRRAGCGEGPQGGVVLSSLRRDEDGRRALLDTLAALHRRGVPVRWDEISPPEDDGIATGADAWLLPLSARSPEALAAQASAFAERVRSGASRARLRDIVYTASVRREHQGHRLAVAGRSREDLAAQLEAFAAGDATGRTARGQVSWSGPPKLLLVFSGQGSQWVGMGRRLLAEEPVFRAEIEACDALLRQHVPWSLLDELAAPEERSRLGETEVVQPALFALQVALAGLLRAWGVTPDAVIGHSVGELAAAYVSGALSLEEAVRVVAWRGRIMQRATGLGKMAWAALPREAAAQVIAGREARLSIAAVNDPGSVVLSGEEEALTEVLAELSARGVEHRPLKVDYAFHSPQMDALAHELVGALGPVDARPARVPFYSTVTGGALPGSALDAAYWGRNVRDPVELSRAVGASFGDGHRLYLEVGPHAVLASHLAQCLAAQQDEGHVASTLRRGGDDRRAMLEALGKLWARGRDVDFRALHPAGGRVVSLPAYPWQRESFWVDAPAVSAAPRRAAGEHPLLGASFVSALHPEERAWEHQAIAGVAPWLSDHRFRGEAVFPGGGFLEMAFAAGAALYGAGAFELAELRFDKMLPLPCAALQLATAAESTRATLTIASRAEGAKDWTRHVVAELRAAPGDAPVGEAPAQIEQRCPHRLEADDHHARLLRVGVEHGPSLRSVEQIRVGDREAIARVRLPSGLAGEAAAYQAHPALLDGCLQVLVALVLSRSARRLVLPVGLSRARLHGRPPEQVWVHVRGDEHGADLSIMDDAGRVLLEIGGLRCAPLDGAIDPFHDCVHGVAWRRCDLPAEVPVDGATGDSRPRAAAELPAERAPWLVVTDARGTGAALSRALRARGEACEEIDASSLEGLPRLLAGACRGVIHCGGLDATPWEDTTTATLEADLRRGTEGAIVLAQAILRRAFRDPPRLFLVTRGAQALRAGPVAAAQAPVWGMARTLSLEHPELECTRIDLAPTPQPDEGELLAREILEGDGEEQIALRAEGRFAARLVRTSLDADAPAAPPAAIVAGGTYLITGGLGGLGLSLAGWMVERGARHLALVGRSAPSDAARAALRALEDAGAEVLVLRGDVSLAADVERLVSEIRKRLPPLRGVVHAAAVLSDRTLLQVDAKDFWIPLRPKVLGAWNLHAATRGEALDFFVMYSSLASLLGSPGQSAYAAGNAFLDALAHARVAEGLPATSIQWGPFTEVGLSAAQDNRGLRMAARGFESFTPAEGTELFGRLLERPRAEVGLFRLSLRRWLESTPQASGMRFLAELPREQAGPRDAGAALFVETLAKAPPADRAGLLEAHVAEQLGRVLCLAPARIDRRAPFSSLGLDSLMSLETRNRLERSLGLKLQPTLFFTYPQVSILAQHLLDRMALPSEAEISGGDARARAHEPRAEEAAFTALSPGRQPDPVLGDDALLAAFDAVMLRFDEAVVS